MFYKFLFCNDCYSTMNKFNIKYFRRIIRLDFFPGASLSFNIADHISSNSISVNKLQTKYCSFEHCRSNIFGRVFDYNSSVILIVLFNIADHIRSNSIAVNKHQTNYCSIEHCRPYTFLIQANYCFIKHCRSNTFEFNYIKINQTK